MRDSSLMCLTLVELKVVSPFWPFGEIGDTLVFQCMMFSLSSDTESWVEDTFVSGNPWSALKQSVNFCKIFAWLICYPWFWLFMIQVEFHYMSLSLDF